MEIETLQKAIKQIEEGVKVLENSKFEKEKMLVLNGRQLRLGLKSEDIETMFNVEKVESVERFVKTNKFNGAVNFYAISGGFICLRKNERGFK